MNGVIWVFKQPDLSECHVIRGLAREGRTQLVVMQPEATPPVSLDLEGVTVLRLRIRGLLDFAAIRALRAALRSGKYTTMYASQTKPLAAVVWASLGMPVSVVAYRGVCGLSRLNPIAWLSYLSPRVNRIVCVSQAVVDFLASAGVAPAKLTRIYKGHDPDWYQPSERSRLASIGIPESAFVVGCCADMRRMKGVYEMLLGLKQIPENRPVHVLLLGHVWDLRILELATEEEAGVSRIHLMGYRDDAPSWVGLCDAFVMPTLRKEGLPRAVIEAMSMGIPPIVTNVGGMPELVTDGVHGIVIPPADPKAMAGAIQRLYENPSIATSMGEKARARIEEDFHVSRTIREYGDLFDALASDVKLRARKSPPLSQQSGVQPPVSG